MQAVIAKEQGGPEVLQLVDLPVPEAGPGQVRVQVRATSLNPIDVKVRKAKLPMTPSSFPAILHTDFAGIVDQVGPGVGQFAVGDEVFGFAGGFRGPKADVAGALAEYLVADVALIARKPTSIGFKDAAALPLVAVTAWRALFEKVTFAPGARVLILGGAGGVGHIAVQLASAAGAHVVATTRTEESARVAKAAGASSCVDLSQTTPADVVAAHTGNAGFDVIFDTVGGASLDAAFQMVRPGGDVVTVVGAASHNLAPLYLRGANLSTVLVLLPIMYGVQCESQGEILQKIAHLVDAGALRARLDPQQFTLTQVAEAHRKFEAGQHAGKLVIEVSGTA